jgi:endonuclease YncB( thermonuclease family)
MKKELIILGFLCFSVLAFAHPGKTDANGCHTNKKTGEYHCHSGKGVKALPAKKEKTSFTDVKLVSVHDGDTFKISLPCNKGVLCDNVDVRVQGIDTPEINSKDTCEKKAAKQAKEFTQAFLAKGQIDLKNCDRDKYFRLLCDVKVNNTDLASQLIKANLAVKYSGGKKAKTNWCNENKN